MDAQQLADACNRDGVFHMAARHWNGSLHLELREGLVLDLVNGHARAASGVPSGETVTLSAPADVWDKLLSAVPPAQCSDLGSARYQGLKVTGNDEMFAQHFAAIARVIELLRIDAHGPAASAGAYVVVPAAQFDSPVGRYMHVELDGHDHRIYVETAGTGIPLLLQHTAGAHGAQWRHLFEDEWLTSRFQLIAYDLPFHGKSLPPTSQTWWAENYRLTTEAFMAVPLAIAAGLELDQPVFMGCSIGGLLALDLARFHPDKFRAVVGVEPSLKVHGKIEAMSQLWHPRVDSGYKAALMEGLVAPQSPEALKKETAFVYSQGWPPSFLGDLYFYVEDHDLTTEAANIDTSQVAVHLMSGEYDWSATPEAGRAAHHAIPGSTFTLMEELGHFPMSENPDRFLSYLRPILETVL